MKKNLILLGLIISLNAFSQSSKFDKINAIPQLKMEYKNVSANDKSDYYLRYLKLKEVNELKNNPEFKNFSETILLQLVDEMYSMGGNNDDHATDDKYISTLASADKKNISGEDIDYEDLLYLYNPGEIYSGIAILELSADKDTISFTRGNATGGNNYVYTYKVKKNKLKLIDTFKQ